MRVIIDTDPGIDDAIALLYALRQPGIETAAITTVGGNIGLEATTRNAGRIATLAGVRVPVHPGAGAPLSREVRFGTAIHGADGLGGVAFPEPADPPSRTGALDAIAALVRHEAAVLFCLGPLTNLARLLERDPGAARRLNRVIAMGGAVDEPGNVGPKAEFNLAYDPEAAAAVLAAGLPLTLIPLDATRKLRADRAFVERLEGFGTSRARAAGALVAAYFAATDGGESRPLHDPCVPLMALHPDAFRCERRALGVDPATGALVPGPHRVEVAMGLDARRLLEALSDGLRD